MTCTHCHREIPGEGSYCMFCGRRRGPSATLFPKPLRRSQVDCRLAGVCGGIARYLDTDPVFIRVAWIILSIVPGTILVSVPVRGGNLVGRRGSTAERPSRIVP